MNQITSQKHMLLKQRSRQDLTMINTWPCIIELIKKLLGREGEMVIRLGVIRGNGGGS